MAAILIYWGHQGQLTLNPFSSVDASKEGVIYHDAYASELRDYITPQGGTPANGDMVTLALAGNLTRSIDVKAKRRVRTEDDRLYLSAAAFSVRTSTQLGAIIEEGGSGGRIIWGMRFLYRTSR